MLSPTLVLVALALSIGTVTCGTLTYHTVRFVGCYIDKGENLRDLPHSIISSEYMTPQLCIQHCKSKGFRYAGVQASIWCHCGNSYGRHGKVDDSECSQKCSGNNRLPCGNDWRNAVYQTGPTIYANKLGCFMDKGPEESRDLPNRVHDAAKMTTDFCIKHCKSDGSIYAAMQAGNWCLCGNSYGRYGRVSDSECSKKCSGSWWQHCGNDWRNTIVATGVDPVKRIGCFEETKPRELHVAKHFPQENTPQLCAEHCKSIGYLYAGVQDGEWCFCGNSYGRYHKASDSACSQKCPGDAGQTCGGPMKSELYSA